MIQIHNTKKDFKQAKEDAVAWWLDSRPLFDEIAEYQSPIITDLHQSFLNA